MRSPIAQRPTKRWKTIREGGLAGARLAWFQSAWCSLLFTSGCLTLGCTAQEHPTWPDTISMVRSKFPQVPQISTAELAEMLEQADPSTMPILLDTRTLEEFQISHLGGAKRVDDIASAIEALRHVPAEQPVVLYCSVGYRSSELASKLMAAGFSNVSNLEGSIFKWANEGRLLENSSGKTHLVHPFDKTWGLLLRRKHWPPAS